MKVNEIRKKMFGLSDLKGLIKENTINEIPHGGGKWQKFFMSHPDYLKPEYDDYLTDINKFWSDEKLWADLNDPVNGLNLGFDPKTLPTLDAAEQKRCKLNYFTQGFKRGRLDTLAGQSNYMKKSSSVAQTNLDYLRDFFDKNSGGISYPENAGMDEMSIKSYVDGIENLADLANKYFIESGIDVRAFDDDGLRVGYEKDPFMLFLLFYYLKYVEKRNSIDKTPAYINNMDAGPVSEYVKYKLKGNVKNQKVKFQDVYSIILNCGRKSVEDLKRKLKEAKLDGEEFSAARSAAYLEIYKKYMDVPVSNDDIAMMASVFEYPANRLFDPLSSIDEASLAFGLQRNASDKPLEILTRLSKQPLAKNPENMCPAEKIFSFARAFKLVLGIDFERALGTSGLNVIGGPNTGLDKKIEVLMSPADIGLQKLEEDAVSRGYTGERIPKAIGKLKDVYRGHARKTEELRLWKLFQKGSNTKTQDEIFYYLLGISDQDTIWTPEYNRYDRQKIEQGENGLVGKSIDILGRKVVGEKTPEPGDVNQENPDLSVKTDNKIYKTLCFEYQGEQHYHPLNVRSADYQYSLFTSMRDYILTECGFVADEETGRKFYHGKENVDDLEVKKKIIEAYKKYAGMLTAFLEREAGQQGTILSRNFSLVSEARKNDGEKSKVDKQFEALTIQKVRDYFLEMSEKSPMDAELFKEPPLEGMVPYLCSPCRFYDEIVTAMGIERDITKFAIISKRTEGGDWGAGWNMVYVTPKIVDSNSSNFTTEDYNYTKRMVGENATIFQWTKEGKAAIARYLETMGFKTPEFTPETATATVLENKNSLFQEIINELIVGRSF